MNLGCKNGEIVWWRYLVGSNDSVIIRVYDDGYRLGWALPVDYANHNYSVYGPYETLKRAEREAIALYFQGE